MIQSTDFSLGVKESACGLRAAYPVCAKQLATQVLFAGIQLLSDSGLISPPKWQAGVFLPTA